MGEQLHWPQELSVLLLLPHLLVPAHAQHIRAVPDLCAESKGSAWRGGQYRVVSIIDPSDLILFLGVSGYFDLIVINSFQSCPDGSYHNPGDTCARINWLPYGARVPGQDDE